MTSMKMEDNSHNQSKTMTAPKGKTPVSLLQEYLVLKKMKAEYVLSYECVGTHLPEFGFRVHVGKLWEEGISNSKQGAKHQAAEKMLIKLQELDKKEIKEMDNKEVVSTTIENFVGRLKEFCVKHGYDEPVYNLINEIGPPHDKVFEMMCTVLKYKHFGVGKSLQLAKHNVASKMLKTLENVVYDRLKENLTKLQCEIKHVKELPKATESELTKNLMHMKVDDKITVPSLGTCYVDQINNFESLKDSSPTLMQIIRNVNLLDKETSLQLIQVIAEELKAKLKMEVWPCHDKKVTSMVLNVSTPIGALGFSKTEAAFNLLNSLILLTSS